MAILVWATDPRYPPLPVVPMSLRDRRFFVRDVSDHRVDQRAYFDVIVEQMENGGLAAMIWDLLHRDIGKFSFRDIPRTAAMKTRRSSLSKRPSRSLSRRATR